MEIPIRFKSWKQYVLIAPLILLISTPFGVASPLTHPPSSKESSSNSQPGQLDTRCQNVNPASKCYKIIPYAQLPNVYGHSSQEQATQELEEVLLKFQHPDRELVSFLCALYFPPCSLESYNLEKSSNSKALTPLPCRDMCEKALTSITDPNQVQGQDKANSVWPVRCQSLPVERCYHLNDQGKIFFVHKPFVFVSKLNGNSAASKPDSEVARFTSIEAELGEDENYDVEVVSLSSSQNPIRRYDITDLGDPELFHGWADVQGLGAANDYCRVIGKGKRRFLSCNLSGSWGQGHHYVSKLGFEVGYPGTWFMRDMDGDGKDDYCRCIGQASESKVICMKAGKQGFYGSTTQGGSQNTFSIPLSNGCHDKKVNAMFGE